MRVPRLSHGLVPRHELAIYSDVFIPEGLCTVSTPGHIQILKHAMTPEDEIVYKSMILGDPKI